MGVCVVENLSRIFLSEWHLLHLWVMRVYIVWVKGKKVTLKNPPSRGSCGYLAGRPYPRDTRENQLSPSCPDSSHSSHASLYGMLTRELPAKTALVFNSLESSHFLSLTQPLQVDLTKYKEIN